jgi:hypothetical protein
MRHTWRRIYGTTSPDSAPICGRCWRSSIFDNTISKLAEAGLLFQVLERFQNVDLHPDQKGRIDVREVAID